MSADGPQRTIESALRTIAAAAPGSEVVFSYRAEDCAIDDAGTEYARTYTPIAASVGEPLQPGWPVSEIERLISRCGLTAGQRSFTREQVDLSLIAEEAAETLLPLAEKRGVTVGASGDIAPTVGSRALLPQMTMNLLHNAIVHNLPEHGTRAGHDRHLPGVRHARGRKHRRDGTLTLTPGPPAGSASGWNSPSQHRAPADDVISHGLRAGNPGSFRFSAPSIPGSAAR